ncbi:MAG: glycerate kinase [Hylemonella sp.]|nr:glycerate kinase [Hylemonella sp.]
MKAQAVLRWAGAAALLLLSYRAWGWGGLALAGGGLTFWGLLHFTRLLRVLRQAADQPVGHVASAVMLNAKLQPGVSLLHVLALTRALGERRSLPAAGLDGFRWTDASGSFVDCEFHRGRLCKWALTRPVGESAETGAKSGVQAP